MSDAIFEALAARIKALTALANHMRGCAVCAKLDVKKCGVGNQFWDAAEMDRNPVSNAFHPSPARQIDDEIDPYLS